MSTKEIEAAIREIAETKFEGDMVPVEKANAVVQRATSLLLQMKYDRELYRRLLKREIQESFELQRM